ncbi:MAG: inverse autotransporter beta domain-containing protein, partial [Alphaproteobacteria bacterium]
RDVPGHITATFGGSGGSGASPSETEELRRYLRGEAESRALRLATNSFEAAGQRYLDERFRVYSTLLWTEENRFSGSVSFVVPLRERGRSVTFLQPGLIAWSGNDVGGKHDRRTDYSLGVVHRIRVGDGRFFGGSLFYDRGRYEHQRVGLGVDYQVVRTRFSGNLYYPLSDSEQGFTSKREHALRGFDATVEQGIGDKFSASFTGGLWEISGVGSEKIGDSKSTFSSDFRYYLSDVLTLRGGYEWSDDFINTADSYRVGVDLRFPARSGDGRGRGFSSDPWAPVKRESRILVARSSEPEIPQRATLEGGALRRLEGVTINGSPSTDNHVARTANDVVRAAVELAEGPAVYYRVNWNAGTAALDEDFTIDANSFRDGTGVDLFVAGRQDCVLVPATVTSLDIALTIAARAGDDAEIIRIHLEPVANEAGCALPATAGTGSGSPQTLATVGIFGGEINISIPLAPGSTGGYDSFVDFGAVEAASDAVVVAPWAVSGVSSEVAAASQRFRVFVGDAGATAPAWPTALADSGDAVEATVKFEAAGGAEFGSSYTVITEGDAAVSAVVLAGDSARYIVTFKEGSESVYFTITLGEGAKYRATDATVTVSLEGGVSRSATQLPDLGTADAPVTLNPTPMVAIGEDALETAAYAEEVAESSGSVVGVPVSVNYLPEVSTTFTVMVAGSSTALEGAGDDYTFALKEVTFTPDDLDKVQELEVTIINDEVFERTDEVIDIILDAAASPADLGDDYVRGNTAAALTITDNEPTPSLSVGDLRIVEGDGGTTATATLAVLLSGEHGEDVGGTFSTVNGVGVSGAVAGSDYTAASNTPFTITAGMTSVDITVAVTGDDIDEVDETFTVTITSGDVALATVLDGSAVVTIADDDAAPELRVPARLSVAENEGVAVIEVTASGESSRDIVVGYAITLGTATVADFAAGYVASGRVTIAAGATGAMIRVPVLVDTVDEQTPEDFTVRISSVNTALATVGSLSSTRVEINDRTIVILRLLDGGNVVTTLTETAAVSKTITVAAKLSKALDPGSDPVPVAFVVTKTGGGPSVTIAAPSQSPLSFAAGEGVSEKTVSFTIPSSINDTATNANGEIVVKATPTVPSSRSNEVSVRAVEAKLAITDDDPEVTFTVSSNSVAEGGSFNLTMTATHPVNSALAVPFAVTLAATPGKASGADFVSGDMFGTGSVTATIPSGQSSVVVRGLTEDDSLVEGAETFTVDFGTLPSGALKKSGTAAQTITITDNDTATLSIVDRRIGEGFRAVFRITVTPVAAVNVSGTLSTADGSGLSGALAPSDYTAVSGTAFTILAGQTNTTVNIVTIQDTIDELDETFTVTITSDDTNLATVGGPATITIRDNDPPPVLTVPATLSVSEKERSVVIPIMLDRESSRNISVGYTVTFGTATRQDFGSAYVASGTIPIAAGATTGTISVPLADDGVEELTPEDFTVTISSVDTALATVGTPAATVVSINDGTVVVLRLVDDAPLSETAAVNKVITAAVKLSKVLAAGSGDVDVDITFAQSGGAPPVTIAPPSQTPLTFAAGEGLTEKTATFMIPPEINDGTTNLSGVITVTATPTVPSSRSNEVAATPSSATLTILDDDPQLALAVLPNPVTEGGSFNLTVTATHPVNGALVVPFAVVLGSATGEAGATDFASGDAFGTGSVTATIPDGATEGVVAGVTADDSAVEGTETFTVDFADLTAIGAVKKNVSSSLEVIIIDNDTATLSVPATLDIAEGSRERLTVTLAPAAFVDASIKYILAGVTAEAGADFTASSPGGTAFGINKGLTSSDIFIQPTADNVVEVDETYTLTIQSSNTNVAVVDASAATTTIKIIDDDTATLTLTAEVVVEGDALSLTAELSKEVEVGASATLTFNDSTNNAAIVFTDTDGDGILNGNERTASATGAWRAGAAGTSTAFSFEASAFPGGLTAAKFTNGKSGAPATVTVTVAADRIVGGIFNFIESSGIPRTWPYAHPYEVSGTSQVITLELPSAPAAAVEFALVVSTDGIPAGEAAAAGVYPNPPTTLTVTPPAKAGVATVTLNPAHSSIGGKVKRFYVVATPVVPNVYEVGTDRVEFAVGLPAAGNFDAIAFYPNELTIERGGSDSFAVVNLRGSGRTNPQGFLAL